MQISPGALSAWLLGEVASLFIIVLGQLLGNPVLALIGELGLVICMLPPLFRHPWGTSKLLSVALFAANFLGWFYIIRNEFGF